MPMVLNMHYYILIKIAPYFFQRKAGILQRKYLEK